MELDFWNGLTGGDGPYMVKLIERFNSQNENIKVEMSAIEWDVFYQKLPECDIRWKRPTGRAHAELLPANLRCPQHHHATGRRGPIAGAQGERLHAGCLGGRSIRRTAVRDPVGRVAYGLYYNKTVMEKGGLDPDKPPQTGDEFISALEQLKAEGIEGWWIEPTYPTVNWLFQSLIPQYGGSLFNEDLTEATINADPNLEVLTWLTDIVRNGYSPKNVGTDTDDVAFQNDKGAFMWIGPWR